MKHVDTVAYLQILTDKAYAFKQYNTIQILYFRVFIWKYTC